MVKKSKMLITALKGAQKSDRDSLYLTSVFLEIEGFPGTLVQNYLLKAAALDHPKALLALAKKMICGEYLVEDPENGKFMLKIDLQLGLEMLKRITETGDAQTKILATELLGIYAIQQEMPEEKISTESYAYS